MALFSSPRRPRRRRAPRLEPVSHSWLAAFWQARLSVRAGVTLDDFLRARLARYIALLPVPHERLPIAVAVEDGQIVARPAETPRAPEAPPPGGVEPWLAPLAALEGPSVRQEVAELEIRLSEIEGELGAARRRKEELARRLASDIAAGLVAAPAAVEATSEQMGRPAVRSTTARTAVLGFVAATVLATAWQVALPLLRAAGIDPSALRAALEGRPAEVAFVGVFALGVTAGLFALADAALRAAARLFGGEDDRRRRRYLAAAGAGAAALLLLVAAALAALPPGSGATPPWAFVLILLALPIAGALLLPIGRAETARRTAENGAVLAWDRERARELLERARRIEELDWATQEELALEQERDGSRSRLRDLNLRASEAARFDREAAERERGDLARVAQGLVSALELDRHEFIRQASARGMAELVTPRRRPEPRKVFEPAAPTPVESGRLAS